MATATLAMDFGAQTGNANHVAAIPGGRDLVERGLSPDQSVVARCLSGDEAAWEEVVRMHTRQVYGLCFRFAASGLEAESVTREVYLRVFKTIKSFRSTEGSFTTWLAQVTRNL